MSILLLSLLFVFILIAAVVLQPRYYENSVEPFHDTVGVQKIMMSPSLSQLITTPIITSEVNKPKIDALSRDAVVQNAINSQMSAGSDPAYDLLAVPHNAKGDLIYSPDDDTIEMASKKRKSKSKSKSKGKKKSNSKNDGNGCENSCPECPDMSQYVRLDEVPCWNCSLP